MKILASPRRKRVVEYRLPQTVHTDFVADFQSAIDESLSEAPLNRDLSFKLEYLKGAWLSKLADSSTTPASERKASAITKWLKADERNLQTNQRLLFDSATFTGGVTSGQIVKFARMVIRQTIGDTPDPSIVFGEFSNGASTRVKRAPGAIARKFVGEAHATPEALEVFKTHVLPISPAWVSCIVDGSFRPVEHEGSVMFTVPKNSEIDRVACKEPEINMFLQRGAGLYLRSALRKRGINLQDQSKNQRLALEGSITRKLATLDLSSASDLISTQLVYDLLPIDWFMLLDSIRVKRTLIGNTWHELSMFSSMGNGFTFELESLLFYALSCAINRAYGVRGRVSVYGDDIVTPTAIAGSYGAIFAWFGFKVNSSKSFWTGKFRESCGKHYYDGTDVTPFFLRERIDTLLELMHQLNLLRAWATRNGDDYWTPAFYRHWSSWSKLVPAYLHGGKDTEDRSCLCTTTRPRKRLTAARRDVHPPSMGAYLHWLHSASHAQVTAYNWRCGDYASTPVKREIALFWLKDYCGREPLVTSLAVLETQIEVTKNRTWDRSLDHSMWFQELML